MHSYLRSIGFSELERKELDQILKEVITQYDEKTVIENSEGHLFVEVSKYLDVTLESQSAENTMKIMNLRWNIIFRSSAELELRHRKMC